jgi:hypothetical protein
VWGAKEIGVAINRSERATFHMLEKGQVPGAKKIAGRWCLDPDVFFAAFRPVVAPEEAADAPAASPAPPTITPPPY